MLFSQVIDQEGVRDQLIGSIRQNRLSHALLFLAPEGAGGLPLALAFSQYVVCTDKKSTDACGICPACKKASQLLHPDIHFSYPFIPKKSGDRTISSEYIREWREFMIQNPYGNAHDWLQFIGAENKQGNIPASECSEIIRQLALKSFESEYKILVMWMPEYLGEQGNKLLKLIEEPPEKTLFILVAQGRDQMLSTLLSRTQLVKIQSLSTESVRTALMERRNMGEKEAGRIARICGGNYREALQLADHAHEDLLELLRIWLNALFTGKSKDLTDWIEQISSAKVGRENQKLFLRYFINLLEQSLRMRYMAPQDLFLLEEETQFAQKLNKMVDFSQMEKIIGELDAAFYHIERNAHGKMLFHALSIKLQYIFKNKTLPL
ncbi:MAG: DNA polymerase III subunit [Chitinophagaceae bacterium]